MTIVSVHEMCPQQKGVIVTINATGELSRRLRDMGLTIGANVTFIGKAPLKDPVALWVGNFTITLRQTEAKTIFVELEEAN